MEPNADTPPSIAIRFSTQLNVQQSVSLGRRLIPHDGDGVGVGVGPDNGSAMTSNRVLVPVHLLLLAMHWRAEYAHPDLEQVS